MNREEKEERISNRKKKGAEIEQREGKEERNRDEERSCNGWAPKASVRGSEALIPIIMAVTIKERIR